MFKDVLYHGTNHMVGIGFSLRPDRGGEYGIFVTPRERYARLYGSHLLRVLVSAKRPFLVRGKDEISPRDISRSDVQELQQRGYDSIVVSEAGPSMSTEVVLFDPGQVWVTRGSLTGASVDRLKEHIEKDQAMYVRSGAPTLVVDGITFRFERHTDAAQYMLYKVRVDKLDALSQRWARDFHVGPGGTGNAIAGRYERFQKFLEDHPHGPIRASDIHLEKNRFVWGDGRHRFAVLRDMGREYTVVQALKDQAGLVDTFLR